MQLGDGKALPRSFHSTTATEESQHPTHGPTSLRWTNVAGAFKHCIAKTTGNS